MFYLLLLIGTILLLIYVDLQFQSYDYLWKLLVANGADGGYFGMRGIACVYRNRLANDMLLDTSQLFRHDLKDMIKFHGKAVEKQAKEIVEEIIFGDAADITMGATDFTPIGINKNKFKLRHLTTTINGYQFYKPKRVRLVCQPISW